MVDRTIERTWRIYKVTCSITGKSYVGLTVDTLRQRWTNHACQAAKKHSRMLLHKAIRKYGRENFSMIELSTHASLEDASTAERKAILDHGTMKPTGYNLAEGGAGTPGVSRPHSSETKRKIGLANKGRVFTVETRAKLSAAHGRRKMKETTREKIREISRRIPNEHFVRMGRARKGIKVHIRTIRLLRAAIARVDAGTATNFRIERSKFSTRISIDSGKKHIGMFPTKEAALAAFRVAAIGRLREAIEAAKELYGEGHPLWGEIVADQYDWPLENKSELPQPAPQQP